MPSAPYRAVSRDRGMRRRSRNTPAQPDNSVWRSYKEDGSVAARNQLVRFYMETHVRPIALRIRSVLPAQVEVDDLIQQGYLGLIDAMDRYEMDRPTSFEVFSRRRISGAIHDYLRAIDPVPRLTRARAKRLQRATDRFRLEFGRRPEPDELGAVLDLPGEQLERFLGDARPPMHVSFSAVTGEGAADGEPTDTPVFVDARERGPLHDLELSDLQRWITRDFDRRDRLIILLYYYEHMTMREIGRALGISESRVSQCLEAIVNCLRARLQRTGAEEEFAA